MRLSIGIRLETVIFNFYLRSVEIQGGRDAGERMRGGVDGGRRRQQQRIVKEPLSAKIQRFRRLGHAHYITCARGESRQLGNQRRFELCPCAKMLMV